MNGLQHRRAPTSKSTAPTSRPPPIFQRSMQWRDKRDAKIRALRKAQAETKGGISMDFSAETHGATVGEHIDAFHRYNMLVGEADGGTPLSEEAYRKLEAICAKASEDRLFCTWRNRNTGMDCVNVGPMTRCFCGHSYRAHAFYANKSKKVRCRVPGCKCKCFEYVYHRGGAAVRCRCKHELADHRDERTGLPAPCKKRGGRCGCKCFVPTVTCSCGASATEHDTVFERRSEREASGRLVRSLWEGMEAADSSSGGGGESSAVVAAPAAHAGAYLPRAHAAMSAGAGGLTSFLSLAPGSERVLVDRSSAIARRR